MVVNTVRTLASKLWHDDAGAVLTTEYLMLGTIVALGGASGLATMSQSVNAEMQEYGNSVRSMRQSYSVREMQTGVASKAGSAAVDSACANGQCDLTP